jgi:hypothetical protein
MKKIILPFLVFALVGFTSITKKLTDAERQMVVKELNKTQDRLNSIVDGLSEEQLNFKSSPESWSVAECVEHLAISENAIGQMLQGAVQTPADPSKRDSVKMTDEKVLAIITNRDQKIKTQESFEPSGKFGNHEETLNAFNTKREEHIEYMKNTEDDLRNHYGQLPFGTIDGVQIVLFMSGHTERHVKQMEEVMEHEDFPEE